MSTSTGAGQDSWTNWTMAPITACAATTNRWQGTPGTGSYYREILNTSCKSTSNSNRGNVHLWNQTFVVNTSNLISVFLNVNTSLSACCGGFVPLYVNRDVWLRQPDGTYARLYRNTTTAANTVGRIETIQVCGQSGLACSGNFTATGNYNITLNTTIGVTDNGAFVDAYWDDVQLVMTWDNTPPKYTSAATNGTGSPALAEYGLKSGVAHRGEVVNISANWTDDVGLSTAWLLTNETGADVNYTYDPVFNSSNYTTRLLSGSGGALVNWTWNNQTGNPRAIKWTIFANDTSNNTNGTNIGAAGIANIGNFTMWGWSNVSWDGPDSPSTNSIGDKIYLQVNVSDANTTWLQPLSGYAVNFYYRQEPNGYVSLGTNMTNSSGIAGFYWDTTGRSTGRYFPMANITHNATQFYNTSYTFNNTNGTIDLQAGAVINYGSGTLQIGVSPQETETFVGRRVSSLNSVVSQRLSRMLSLFRNALNTNSFVFRLQRPLILLRQDTQQLGVMFSFSDFVQFTAKRFLTLQTMFNFNIPNASEIFARVLINAIRESPLAARIISVSKLISQSFAANAISSRFATLGKIASQFMNFNANIQQLRGSVRFVAQSFTFNAATTRILSATRSLVNAMTFTNLSQRLAFITRAASQQFAADAISSRFSTLGRLAVQAFSSNVFVKNLLGALRLATQPISTNIFVARMDALTRTVSSSFNFSTLTSRFSGVMRIVSQSFNAIIAPPLVQTTFNKAITQFFTGNTFTSRLSAIWRSISQSFAFSALADRISSFNRVLTNSISSNFVVTAVFEAGSELSSRFASLAITVSNNLSNALSFRRLATQSFAANFAFTRISGMFRLVVQSLSFSSVSARIDGFLRITSQTLSINSLVGTTASAMRTAANSASFTSIISRMSSLGRSANQAFSANAIAQRIIALGRIASQQFAANIAIKNLFGLARTASQSFANNIATRNLFGAVRTASQQLNANVLPARMFAGLRSVASTLTFANLPQRIISISKAISQPVTANAFASRIFSVGRSAVQQFSANIAASRLFIFGRAPALSIAANTMTKSLLSLGRILTQPIGSNVFAFRSAIVGRIAAASSAFGSFASTASGTLRLAAQAFTGGFASSRIMSAARAISDSVSFTNVAQRILSVARAASQQFAANTISSRALNLGRLAAQAFSSNIFVKNLLGVLRLATQPISTNIFAARLASFSRAVSQIFSTNIVPSRLLTLFRTIQQSLNFTSLASRMAGAARIAFQSFSSNIVSARIFSTVRSVTGQITPNLISQRTLSVTKAITQSVTANTLATRILSTGRLVSQQLSANAFATRFSTLGRLAVQSFTANTTFRNLYAFARAASQPFASNTFASRITSVTKTISQTISFNTISTRMAAFVRIASSPSSFNIAVTSALIHIGNINNAVASLAVSFTSGVSKTLDFAKTTTQTISFSTLATRIATFGRAVSSAFSLNSLVTTASTQLGTTKNRVVSLAASFTNSASRILGLSRPIVQQFNMSILSQRVTSLGRILSQMLTENIITANAYSIYRALTFSRISTMTTSFVVNVIRDVTVVRITLVQILQISNGYRGPVSENKTISNASSGTSVNLTIVHSEDLRIEQLQINLQNNVSNAQLTLTESPDRSDSSENPATSPGIDVANKYLEITKTNITDVDINNVTINFKVENGWIFADQIDANTIRLKRLTGSTWTDLSTVKINQDETYVYYQAVSPGLSVFAITGNKISTATRTVSGGGSVGGGEGIITPPSLNISFNPQEIDFRLEPGGKDVVGLEITNNGATDVNMNLATTPEISSFITFDKPSLLVKAGSTQLVRVIIQAPSTQETNVITGNITATVNGRTYNVRTIIIVISKAQYLLDVKVNVLDAYKTIFPGKQVVAFIQVYNQGQAGKIDFNLTYGVRNTTAVLASETETLAVETQTAFVRLINMPDSASLGSYEFFAIAQYSNVTATSQSQFTVMPKQTINVRLVIIGVIAAGVVALVGVVLLRKTIYESMLMVKKSLTDEKETVDVYWAYDEPKQKWIPESLKRERAFEDVKRKWITESIQKVKKTLSGEKKQGE